MFSSLVGSNGLAVIRDVEDPEPPIEPEFPIIGIRPDKMDSSRLGRFWAMRHNTYPPPPKHIQTPSTSRQFSVTETKVRFESM